MESGSREENASKERLGMIRATKVHGQHRWAEAPADMVQDALITILSGNGTVSLSSAAIFSTYYFPHLAVGGGWQTTMTYVNSSSQAVTCEVHFFPTSARRI